MLFDASFKDSKILIRKQIVELKRGQLQGSISYFVKRWNATKDQVIGFLKLLQNEGMINKSTDRNITIITICNYDSYQGCSDNKSDNKSNNKSDNIPDNKSDTNIEGIEGKEINNKNNNSACTREESVGWDDSVENSYFERFKAQGSAREVMRVTGKKLDEVMKLLDVYRAKRKMQNRGHKDFYQFCYLFSWAVENNRISLPVQTAQPKVTSNADTLRLMEEMGWRGN